MHIMSGMTDTPDKPTNPDQVASHVFTSEKGTKFTRYNIRTLDNRVNKGEVVRDYSIETPDMNGDRSLEGSCLFATTEDISDEEFKRLFEGAFAPLADEAYRLASNSEAWNTALSTQKTPDGYKIRIANEVPGNKQVEGDRTPGDKVDKVYFMNIPDGGYDDATHRVGIELVVEGKKFISGVDWYDPKAY